MVDGSLGVPVTPRLVQNQQQAVAAPLLLAISVHNTKGNTNNININITTKINDQLYPNTITKITTNTNSNTNTTNNTTISTNNYKMSATPRKRVKNHKYPNYFCPNQQQRNELIQQWLRVATIVDLGRPSSLCSPFTASHS